MSAKRWIGLGVGVVSAGAAALLLSHCSMYSMTGDMSAEYAVEHMAPYLMSTDDLDMACETGVSLGAALLSFSRVTDVPHKAATSTLLTAGMCAESLARNEELRGLRAVFAGQAAEAQDARIGEKRAHAVAAKRYYRGYTHLTAHYGEPGDKCPAFEDETDELTWLLGLMSGVQAVQHDRGAGGEVGVPLDLPAKAARGTECLNNERWWGVPAALRAAVWTSVPGTAPAGADPWKTLADASALGEKSGVRLAQAIQAQSAASAGKPELVRQVITAFAESRKKIPAAEKWRLLDETGAQMIEFYSDRLWTEAKGHRTPHGGLGTFWDAAQEKAEDDLFEGLEAAPTADGGTPAPTDAAPVDAAPAADSSPKADAGKE